MVNMVLLKFDIYFDGKYWCARGLDADIFTQGRTLDELLKNLKEAVLLYVEDKPATILLLGSLEVKGDVAQAASS